MEIVRRSKEMSARKKLFIIHRIIRNNMIVVSLNIRLTETDDIGILNKAAFTSFLHQFDSHFKLGILKRLLGVSNEKFNQIEQFLRIRRKHAISNVLRLAVFLKFAREGLSQSNLALHIGLSQSTISRILHDVISDINQHGREIITMPSKQEILQIEEGFWTRGKGFRAWGALDGKHWSITHPPHSGALNMNYKGHFSFNSLALCDHEGRIMYLQISENGCNSDAQLYNSGPLDTLLSDPTRVPPTRNLPGTIFPCPAFVFADNGFRLTTYCQTPFRQSSAVTGNIMLYNTYVSSHRVKVENLFGRITSRFRCLRRSVEMDTNAARGLVVTCCILHNFLIGRLVHDGIVRDETGVACPYSTGKEFRERLMEFVLNFNS